MDLKKLRADIQAAIGDQLNPQYQAKLDAVFAEHSGEKKPEPEVKKKEDDRPVLHARMPGRQSSDRDA